MARGILIFGAAGTGKTTLGKAVARLLGFRHIDIDDYIWSWDTEKPYTELRPRQERIKAMMNEIEKGQPFIMTGSMWSIRTRFNPLFDMAVLLKVPTPIRMERLYAREQAMLGDRILPGGDMHEHSKQFFEDASNYDTGDLPLVCAKGDALWAEELDCTVLAVDGTKKTEENALWLAEQYRRIAN